MGLVMKRIIFVIFIMALSCGGDILVPVDPVPPTGNNIPDGSGGYDIVPIGGLNVPPFNPQPGDPGPGDDGGGNQPGDESQPPAGDIDETDNDVPPGDIDAPTEECEGKVIVCHMSSCNEHSNEGHQKGHGKGKGNHGNHSRWHTIEIGCDALAAHLEHGDLIGECP